MSFLLNNHSSIATIGHTMGWRYKADEDFRCSCGNPIKDCPLFKDVSETFNRHGLAFDPQNFGTAFRFSDNARVNQLLTGPLPFVRLSLLETARDSLVSVIPRYRELLARQQKANFLLMATVLRRLDADVYLDNSHSPYRLRALNRNDTMDVYPVHLIRDPRGVALSLMTNSGFSVSEAINNWLRHQLNIMRIAAGIRAPLVVSYESLCLNTEAELERLHSFVGVEYEKFEGNFKKSEHHILGNRMRLSNGTIRLDERWRTDLSKAEVNLIESKLRQFMKRDASHPLALLIGSYMNDN